MGFSPYQLQQHIRELQTYLHTVSIYDSRIPRVIPDGIYGKQTSAAVSAFQRENGLTETGEANPATWDKIVLVYRDMAEPPRVLDIFPAAAGAVLQEGSEGLDISVIQAILGSISEQIPDFPVVSVTGVYDPQTVRGVQAFRGIASLPVENYVDKQTWNQLAAWGRTAAMHGQDGRR